MMWPAITALMDSDEFVPDPPFPMDPTPPVVDPEPEPDPDPPVDGGEGENPDASG